MVGKYDEQTEFTIITYAPEEVSKRAIWVIQIILGIIFAVAYSFTLIGIYIFTKKLTEPITLLSDTMRDFDDSKLDKTIHIDTNTELDDIGHAYNDMLAQVKSLMEDVKAKEAELRKSELNTLMYQIRPHFLYNTLDNIYMLARIQKEETIMKMIQDLSKLLRINLNNGKEEITIEKELEYVSSYLDIQKIRNDDLFDYTIECEEDLKQIQIMKMILQPITENCIKYGFADIYRGGMIKIQVYEEENFLCFRIENNGKPVDPMQLEKLNQLEQVSMEEIDDVIKKRQGGFGVCNVAKRLRLRYKEQIRFFYNRKEKGTECFIKIKKELVCPKEDNHE